MLAERDVRDEYVRHILYRPVVPSREPFAMLIRTDERARLIEECVAIASRRLVGREQLVDLHDEPGQRV